MRLKTSGHKELVRSRIIDISAIRSPLVSFLTHGFGHAGSVRKRNE